MKVVGETPAPAQGETEARPMPVPRINRMIEIAEAVTPPAKIAAHETPDAVDAPAVPAGSAAV